MVAACQLVSRVNHHQPSGDQNLLLLRRCGGRARRRHAL